jgi:hypothetical protein
VPCLSFLNIMRQLTTFIPGMPFWLEQAEAEIKQM